MSTIENIKQRYEEIQSGRNGVQLKEVEQHAYNAFSKMGIPNTRHEEWKYTPIHTVFKHDFAFDPVGAAITITEATLDEHRLPGHELANELVFVNGFFAESLSKIQNKGIVVLPLEEAIKKGFENIITNNIGNSAKYVQDGVYALNTAFIHNGIFIHFDKSYDAAIPVYIYQVADARTNNNLSLPRTLIYAGKQVEVQLVETYVTLGTSESLTNQVMEIIVDEAAHVEYYKIQNDVANASMVSTTHFRQIAKSFMHAVTISLNGAIVRNNLNISMEAEWAEAHLYGLYFLQGKTHVDNHTVVDNIMPNCLSNELYKGIIDDNATAVFNGKIFVQKDAQKTNAFQSNKNILLSNTATVNTKPQLEIFADDVKCSHGCTVGQLDEEGLFYLRSRGITEKIARSMLVHGYVIDILDKIKPVAVRNYIDELISERLEYEIA